MKSAARRSERGIALIALLAVIALGASWFLVARLNNDSNQVVVANRTRNAAVLNRAKQALIGYMAAQAAFAGENRPGAFPCPEAPGNFYDPANEGTVSYPCSLPIVGRFPWKTLGLDKLVDSSGEPLWYAIASGWAGANTVINSNCASYDSASTQACRAGRLSVDGVTGDVVALIIAPGPAITVSASTNCTAWTQTRPMTAPPDWRNYLECQNATNPADNTFATTGPSGSFNDQLVTIGAAEIIPAIEAAIASRIQREIVPPLQTVYTPAAWGFSGTKPIYPYAAPFTDPSTSGMGGATSTLQGVSPILFYAGLLPVATSETYPGSGIFCAAGASAPLCQPNFVAWTSPSLAGVGMLQPSCAAGTANTIVCNYYRTCFISCSATPTYSYTITATIANVGMALRKQSIDTTKMTNVGTAPPPVVTPSPLVMTSAGTVPFTITGTTTSTSGGGLSGAAGGLLCGLVLPFLNICRTETITIPMTAVLVDHPLLDSRTSSSTGWFIRNRWHELTYFAVVQGHTPVSIAAPGCIDSPPASVTCLSATNVSPANKLRAILVLAGRSINGGARPSATLGDYLEFGNAAGSFEQRAVTTAFGTTYADTGSVNAYAIAATSVPAGTTLRFKAAATNTGAATLTSPATGLRNLVNSDGSALAASAIQANGVVEVVFDGTQFFAAKRPFNDRIVVVDNN
jgi:hypothetical protein